MSKPSTVQPGCTYGRLTVLREAGRHVFPSGASTRKVECLCECGNTTVVYATSVKSGNTQSCGCLIADSTRARTTKHGRVGTPAYHVWGAIIQRCTNPKHPGYKDYGGRGISVCDRWLSFDGFYADMGDPPPGLSIDRADNDAGYSPENCRWADSKTQSRNQRPQRGNRSGVRGVSYCSATGRWKVSLRVGDTTVWGGRFSSLEAATEKRRQLEQAYWGNE
ncbi:AP2 domain protein [compost metagenome]